VECTRLLVVAFGSALACLCNFPAEANEAGPDPDVTETEFVISYDVERVQQSWFSSLLGGSSSLKSGKMKLWVNLPQTIPGKQEVAKVLFKPEPSRQFRKNGNYYVEYHFDLPRKSVRFEIIVRAKIMTTNLATVMNLSSATTAADPNLDSYLVHERMIEKDDPLILELASEINGEGRLDTVRKIFHFVPTYLSIDLTKNKGIGAAKTAETKKGKCIDYCDFFVALCRAKSIPARVVAGLKCRFNASPKHSWVEAYVEPYGWISLDPTILPNVPHAAVEHRFHNYRPNVLRFTSIRNDRVLHYNYFYSFPFWDKELMKEVRVFESIEFIKPERLAYSSKRRRKMAEETQKAVDERIEKQRKSRRMQK